MFGIYNCCCYFGFYLNEDDSIICEMGNLLLISFDFV